MNTVWILSRGNQHEGGNVTAVYADVVKGLAAVTVAAHDLRTHWVEATRLRRL